MRNSSKTFGKLTIPIFVLLAIFFSLLSEQAFAAYCDASGSNLYHYIKGVQVGSINNIPTGNSIYADYTSLSTAMLPEVSYPITVTRGNPWDPDYDYCRTWVDWNQDEDFYDVGEEIVMSLGVDPCTFTGTITPPADAGPGDTRMRVRIVWNEVPQPCGGSNYGEVEDYTITIAGLYGGGGGTAEDPYLIRTAEHMNEIGTNPGDWDKHFKLVADIDLSAFTGTAFNIIGTSDLDPFTGTFDGNDHTISNFNYSSTGTDYIGIFGCISGGNAEIKNLGLIDPNIDAGTGDRVGALAGTAYHGSLAPYDYNISDCYVTGGNISGGWDVGGMIGRTDGYDGIVSNCNASCNVSGTGSVGGLIGDNNLNNFSNCHSSGTVSGTNQAVGGLIGSGNGSVVESSSSATVTGSAQGSGGLIGWITLGPITQSFSTGSVLCTGNSIGGLAGVSWGTIDQCYSTSNVSGNDKTGGLVGNNGDVISDSFATGDVSGNEEVGGLIGRNWHATISNCYSAGRVTGSSSYIGGLIAFSQGSTVNNSFWDKDASGLDISAGGIRKTTSEMFSRYTYSMAGWDFVTPVWTICHMEDYPKLWFDSAKYGGGSGTEGDPYLIFSSCQMNKIGADSNDWDKHFKLMRNIDFSGFAGDEFNIIGGPDGDFSGSFDGNYHLLYDFDFTYSVSEYMYLGIFGKVNGQNAQIKNLGLINPRIEGGSNGQIIGSLVGELNSGTVSNCFAKGGSVSGNLTIGGLIGRSWGTIENCYSLVDVSGDDFAGGLAGVIQDGTMNDCYSAGRISGDNPDHTGGLIGGNFMGQGVITDS
ncbi:MAG: GLUG motif-containing protein, partial [Planctomycetota bacterium]